MTQHDSHYRLWLAEAAEAFHALVRVHSFPRGTQ
jgi:hypothetical protein